MAARIQTPITPTKTPLVDDEKFVTDLWSAFFDRLLSSAIPVPTGGLTQFAGDTAPKGWLLCNGQEINRNTYYDLFATIGIKYGAGDGSSTFNVPNTAGRVLVGAADASELGQTGGTSEVLIELANLPAVNLTVTDPGHTHTFTGIAHSHTVPSTGDATGGGSNARLGGAGNTSTSSTTAGGTNSVKETGITVSLGGGGEGIDTAPPYIKVNFIIKA